jgi:hypothetical protein
MPLPWACGRSRLWGAFLELPGPPLEREALLLAQMGVQRV